MIPISEIEKVIAEFWAKCHEHTEGYQDAESLFEQKRDEGAADAFELAANRLKELLPKNETNCARNIAELKRSKRTFYT